MSGSVPKEGEEYEHGILAAGTDGEEVCLWYDLVTNSPAGTALVSEGHHVEGDRIRSIHVVFDARPFAPLFAKARGGR